MRLYRLAKNGEPRPLSVYCCDTFLQRARGLYWASAQERTLVWRLRPCSAVHTLFLSMPIDVAFCDRRGRVMHIVSPMGMHRWAWWRGADSVWEFPAGAIRKLTVQRGDRLTLCP